MHTADAELIRVGVFLISATHPPPVDPLDMLSLVLHHREDYGLDIINMWGVGRVDSASTQTGSRRATAAQMPIFPPKQRDSFVCNGRRYLRTSSRLTSSIWQASQLVVSLYPAATYPISPYLNFISNELAICLLHRSPREVRKIMRGDLGRCAAAKGRADGSSHSTG